MIKKIKIPSKREVLKRQRTDDLVKETAIVLKCKPDDIYERAKSLLKQIEHIKEKLDSMNKKLKG